MTEETTKKGKTTSRKHRIKTFMGGSLLASEKVMKQMPFVFYLVLLAILMITNRYYSEKVIRQIETVQDSIMELKAESVTYETDLMRMNRPSEITEKVNESGLDLIEPQEPPQKLKVEKLEN